MVGKQKTPWWHLRVCIFAPFAYALFDPDSRARFGGAEVRAARLARGLAGAGGTNVSVVVLNHGHDHRQTFDGVEVISVGKDDDEHPLSDGASPWTKEKCIAFLARAEKRLWPYILDFNKVAAYLEADADVYIGFGVNDWTAELAAFTRAAGRKMILLASSDEDFSEFYAPCSANLNSYFSLGDRCHFALMNTDRLIVQTERQRMLALERFGLDAAIMRSPAPSPAEKLRPKITPQRFIWIGRADQVKQPDVFVQLAREFPDTAFEMVLNPNLDDVAERVHEGKPENLAIRDYVPYDRLDEFIQGATAIVNTSRFEGFPNTFLDAWSAGIPVLSLHVDPDGVISRHGCGVAADGDWTRFVTGARRLLEDTDFHRDCRKNAGAYLKAHHLFSDAVNRLDGEIRHSAGNALNRLYRRQASRRRHSTLAGKSEKWWRRRIGCRPGDIGFGILKRDIHVCFVAPYSYSLFDPATDHRFGGIEVQAHLLATELAMRDGFNVSFAVWDHGQPARKTISKVLLFSCPQEDQWRAEISGKIVSAYNFAVSVPPTIFKRAMRILGHVNFLTSRKLSRKFKSHVAAINKDVSGLKWRLVTIYYKVAGAGWKLVDMNLELLLMFKKWRALGRPPMKYNKRIFNVYRFHKYKNINADVYLSFGASNFTAELAAFCGMHDKEFMLLVASDSDLSEDYYKGSTKKNYYGDIGDRCNFAIRSADKLVVQTDQQKKLARDLFGLDSEVIENPIDLSVQPDSGRAKDRRSYVAWIGKADDVKRPELFVELARRFPDMDFRMVMNRSREEVEERVLASLPDNLTWIEKLPRLEVPIFLEEALVLVNTSRFEGLPNVCIEACRAGTPLLSLSVDPEEMLRVGGCGLFADSDFEVLVGHLRSLMDDDKTWKGFHEQALDYVARRHDRARCVDKLVEEIETLYQGPVLRPFFETSPTGKTSPRSPAPRLLRERA